MVVLWTAGCGLRIGEVYQEPSVAGTSLGCMNNLDEQLQAYLQQNLPEKEIGTFTQCLQTALLVFKYHVWGKDRTAYTPEELRSFIQTFFLQDRPISDPLLSHLMILKTALVGGEYHQLTLNEIDQLIQLMNTLGEEARAIYPYHHILFSPKEPVSDEELDQGIKQFEKTIKRLSETLFHHSYSLDSAAQLAYDLKILLNVQSTSAVNWEGVIRTFSSFVFSQEGEAYDVIQPDEWEKLASAVIHLMSAGIYFFQGLQETQLLQRKLKYFSNSFDGVLNLVRLATGTYNNKPLSRNKLRSFFYNLQEYGLISQNIRKESLDKTLFAVFGKILNQLTAEKMEENFIVSAEGLQFVSEEFNRWRHIQDILDQSLIQMTKEPHTFAFSFASQPSFPSSVQSYFHELTQFYPLYMEEPWDDFHIYLTNNRNTPKMGYKNLSFSSLYQSVARLLMRGYAHMFSGLGMTENELAQLLGDIYGLTEDLGIQASVQNPESDHFGRAEFLAANLMIYETQGFYTDSWDFYEGHQVEYISLREGTEYLSFLQFLFSSLNELREELYKLCSHQIKKSCFYKNILQAVSHSMQHTPHFVRSLSQMSADEKQAYTDLLFKIAVVDPQEIETLEVLETSHLRNLVLALMYQEVMFTRYNTNANAVLEHEEVEKAYPLYRGLIHYVGRDLLCLDIQDIIEDELDYAAFAYIVSQREVPKIGAEASCAQKATAFVQLETGPYYWDLDLTRPQVMKVALSLAQSFVKNTESFGNCEDKKTSTQEAQEKEEESPSQVLQFIKSCFSSTQ